MKLSLSQLKKMHENNGRRPIAVKVTGHVDVIVRNLDGEVDQAASKKNLTTDMWNDIWSFGPVDLRNMNVFILPDDGGDVHKYKTAGRHLYQDNYEVYAYAALNSSTDTWTWTAVFNPPAANRVFRYIGLKSNAGIGTDSVGRSVTNIYAMTKMTSDISQSTIQTLEIVYRVSFSRA